MAGDTVLEPELIKGYLRGPIAQGCKLPSEFGIAARKGVMDELEVSRNPGDLLFQHEDRDLLEIVCRCAHESRPDDHLAG